MSKIKCVWLKKPFIQKKRIGRIVQGDHALSNVCVREECALLGSFFPDSLSYLCTDMQEESSLVS